MTTNHEFTCDDLDDWRDAMMCTPRDLTSEDLAFARLCGALAHRPQLTAHDRTFAQLVDELTFTHDFYAQPHHFQGRELVWGLVCARFEELAQMVQAAMRQPVSEAQGRAFRHGMHSHGEEGSYTELYVPVTWRAIKPKRNAWQRAADELAAQITKPLDEIWRERKRAG
jgi:hypothetical protein